MVVLGPGVLVLGISSTNLTTFFSRTYSASVVTVVTVVSLPLLPTLDNFLLVEMFVITSVAVLVSLLVLGIMTMILQW